MNPHTNILASRRIHGEKRRCSGSDARKLKVAVAAFLCAITFLSQSKADPIRYTFSGIGTGSVGASPFNNAAFSVDVYSDTTNVVIAGFTGGRNMYSADASSATFTIAGIGTGTFTLGTRVFNSGGIPAFGFSRSLNLGGDDLWDFSGSALANYDLRGPFGPINATPAVLSGNIANEPTTLGNLTFNLKPNITFTATMIPEPSTACFFSAALFTIALLRRGSRR